MRFITPVVMAAMCEFQVNPTDQNLDSFLCVMIWSIVIAVHLSRAAKKECFDLKVNGSCKYH